MAETLVSYAPLNVIAGDGDVKSIRMTLKANAGALGAFTPVMFETVNYQATPVTALTDLPNFIGFLAPVDPSNASGITPDANGFYGYANSAATQEVIVYVSGDFFQDIVPWPAAFNSTGKKQYLVKNTGITVVTAKTGQV